MRINSIKEDSKKKKKVFTPAAVEEPQPQGGLGLSWQAQGNAAPWQAQGEDGALGLGTGSGLGGLAAVKFGSIIRVGIILYFFL